MATTLDVNGERRTTPAASDTPLLYVLRNDLELNAAKYGCGFGQCGACTVIVDGQAVRSCVTPVSAVVGKKIVTLEGLGTVEKPGALQRAFIAEQAAQCGYCVAGMMMSAQASPTSWACLTRWHSAAASAASALSNLISRNAAAKGRVCDIHVAWATLVTG